MTAVTAEAAVRVEGLGHSYGGTQALSDVGLSMRPGETLALVGPDGVGKSSLMALIAGVKKIQTGTVDVLGGSMADARHRDGVAPRLAFMPQGLGKNLYPSLSVVENVDFFARLYGEGAEERGWRIERLLTATGLAPFPDRPAGNLSGGMKQKLALCCALVHDPDLLILDEPTTGVDPLSRRQFWELIGEIREDRPAMTVIVATAYMEEAARFGRLIAMNGGRILADGSPAELLARTGASSLEQAYVALSSGEQSGGLKTFVVPPRVARDGPPAIEAHELTRRFGNFTAVDHVSFRIARGEIFGFLGSNGCGKTTTMKMLTGLLAMSEGSAELLGQPIDAQDLTARMRVGYVSQSFSLYEELTVVANLTLHARLYRLEEGLARRRINEALERFGLTPFAEEAPARLPLGIRQRLQLAAAVLHRPEVLILDEPTSGVDPAARDLFWHFLVELSRDEGVTIFVSTHFMNEAERCDRISLMHAGRVLAIGRPEELTAAMKADTLDTAFIRYLEVEEAERGGGAASVTVAANPITVAGKASPAMPNGGGDDERAAGMSKTAGAGFARIRAFAFREAIELLRDPIRLAFALLGPLVLMTAFAYGISFDVEDITFAALDRDRSAESRDFLEGFRHSAYFHEQPPLAGDGEIERRLRSGEVRVVIDISPGFGSDLLAGRIPEVAFLLDGSNPFRAETVRGYLSGVVLTYAKQLAMRELGSVPDVLPVSIEPRFRYNQAFRSVFAITPGIIMLLLVLIPAMLTAVGVVREKELGSILNVYASPASIAEFLIGKQLPYIAVGFISYLTLITLAWLQFGVVVSGSLAALTFGAALYVFAATGFGLLMSSFVRSQVAAIFATAILTVTPAVNFSGFMYPVSNLEGMGRIVGQAFPALWFQTISIGCFAKEMGFMEFLPEYLALIGFGVGFLTIACLIQTKQER
ncbi:ribosome-associated ATPase/putative transporter RbbA [Roseibium litorale]|uniref:Ribosome-associated ATPase/putative transporter RbbA n=1 Tax=Roseibium litorale TaxID=2803841 RepID=A0ABR9CP73_9HYPH|nr:ribosome-associated ATPase/putative transporter RbbA [Roseibium litorale]MBD8892669.1 ribosome-associated ATPase/putative transporter RbbA [Roseibium litorale]